MTVGGKKPGGNDFCGHKVPLRLVGMTREKRQGYLWKGASDPSARGSEGGGRSEPPSTQSNFKNPYLLSTSLCREDCKPLKPQHKTNKSLYKSCLTTQGESNGVFFSSRPPQDTMSKKEKEDSSCNPDVFSQCSYDTVLI